MAIDMDAARRERQGKAPVVKLGGKKYTLPKELPYQAVEHMASLAKAQASDDGPGVAQAIDGLLGMLLGDRAAEFIAHGLSTQDLEVLFEGVVREYGFGSPGESSASASS